jgi:hypothetical protein
MRHPRRTQGSATLPSDPDSIDLSSLLSSLSPTQISRAHAVQSRLDRINQITSASLTSTLHSELFVLESGTNVEEFRNSYIDEGHEDIQFTRAYLFGKLDYVDFKARNFVEVKVPDLVVYDGSEMKISLSRFLSTW